MSTVYMHTYSRRIYYKYVLQVVARLVKAERIATHCIEEVALLTKEWETAHAYATSRVVVLKSKTSTPIYMRDIIYNINIQYPSLRDREVILYIMLYMLLGICV